MFIGVVALLLAGCEATTSGGPLAMYANRFLGDSARALCEMMLDARWPEEGNLRFCYARAGDSTGFALIGLESSRVLETGFSLSVSNEALPVRFDSARDQYLPGDEDGYAICSEGGIETGRRRIIGDYFLTVSRHEKEARVSVAYTLGTPRLESRCEAVARLDTAD